MIATLKGLGSSFVVTIRDQFGRITSSLTGPEMSTKLSALFKKLATATSAAARQKIIEEIQSLFALIPDLLSQASGAFDTAFSAVTTRIMTAFDRETTSHIAGMQKAMQAQVASLTASTNAEIASLEASAAAAIRKVQKKLAADLKKIQELREKMTPLEQSFLNLTAEHNVVEAGRKIAQAQEALAKAAPGTDEAVQAQADLDAAVQDERMANLEKAAQAERDALEKKLAEQEDKLNEAAQRQEERINAELESKKAALQAALDAQVATLEEEEANREADYQDQRDALKTELEAELAAKLEALKTGAISWDDFVKWLQGKNASGCSGRTSPTR